MDCQGAVSLKRKDGTLDYYVLFTPWGYIKHNNSYPVSDLGGLRKALLDEVERHHLILK
jgi:hypothetical protein